MRILKLKELFWIPGFLCASFFHDVPCLEKQGRGGGKNIAEVH